MNAISFLLVFLILGLIIFLVGLYLQKKERQEIEKLSPEKIDAIVQIIQDMRMLTADFKRAPMRYKLGNYSWVFRATSTHLKTLGIDVNTEMGVEQLEKEIRKHFQHDKTIPR